MCITQMFIKIHSNEHSTDEHTRNMTIDTVKVKRGFKIEDFNFDVRFNVWFPNSKSESHTLSIFQWGRVMRISCSFLQTL